MLWLLPLLTCDRWYKAPDIWPVYLTYYTCHLTPDTWHLTWDTQDLSSDRGHLTRGQHWLLQLLFLTPDTWHLTPDTSHITHKNLQTNDTYQVTHDIWLGGGLVALPDTFSDMWHLTPDMWHLTPDTWQLTPDTWYVNMKITPDMWHLTLSKWLMTPDYGVGHCLRLLHLH